MSSWWTVNGLIFWWFLNNIWFCETFNVDFSFIFCRFFQKMLIFHLFFEYVPFGNGAPRSPIGLFNMYSPDLGGWPGELHWAGEDRVQSAGEADWGRGGRNRYDRGAHNNNIISNNNINSHWGRLQEDLEGRRLRWQSLCLWIIRFTSAYFLWLPVEHVLDATLVNIKLDACLK